MHSVIKFLAFQTDLLGLYLKIDVLEWNNDYLLCRKLEEWLDALSPLQQLTVSDELYLEFSLFGQEPSRAQGCLWGPGKPTYCSWELDKETIQKCCDLFWPFICNLREMIMGGQDGAYIGERGFGRRFVCGIRNREVT